MKIKNQIISIISLGLMLSVMSATEKSLGEKTKSLLSRFEKYQRARTMIQEAKKDKGGIIFYPNDEVFFEDLAYAKLDGEEEKFMQEKFLTKRQLQGFAKDVIEVAARLYYYGLPVSKDRVFEFAQRFKIRLKPVELRWW